MKMVPINVENIDFIRLDLSRHYIQIDCDFVCYIVLNPSGTIPVGGTDVCAFHVGAWQVDAWKFLTKDFAQVPGFSACLVWDRTLVTELSKAPQVAESDIDTANSISSLKGQPVNITGFSLAEGESLKMSTLDDEWVNVKPFDGSMPVKSLEEEWVNVKPFNDSSICKRSLFRNIKVGDPVDDLLLSHVVDDDGSAYTCLFEGMVLPFNTSGSSVNLLCYQGRAFGCSANNFFEYAVSVRITISYVDGVITSIHRNGIIGRLAKNLSSSSSDYYSSFSLNADIQNLVVLM